MKHFSSLFFLLFSSLAAVATAGQLNLQLENDFPWHDDADYTHGTRIEYVLDDGLRFGVQQQMYTPLDLRNADQVPGRHPYAGTLLGFVGYKEPERLTDSLTFCHDIEFYAGVLGPSSHADDVQRFIHKVLGCKDPKGWNNQLHDEFEIGLSYWPGLDWRVAGEDYGWSLHWVNEVGGLLGTLQIAGGANTELKLGYGFGAAEDDHEMRVRAVREPAGHVYVLAGAEGRVWGRNELLEGNASYVHNNVTIPVDMETWTGCLKAGVGARYKNLEARCLWMWWSREYKTQESVPHYMSLTVGWRF